MTEPFWLSVARAFKGLPELPGPANNNPCIIQWATDVGVPPGAYSSDEVPWCALFVNRILLACGLPMSGRGWDLLRAKSFETYGSGIALPALGAILVFTRPGGGGHVGFYLGERQSDGAYYVLGGNQSNSVSGAWLARNRCSHIRWPSEAGALPRPDRILLTSTGQLSENEA